jgi:adenylate cyclase
MGIEIERKFLLANNRWRGFVSESTEISQAYLGGTHCLVRVRLRADAAFLTIKSKTLGLARQEFEYAIPANDARSLIAQFADGASISKQRHIVLFEGYCFEIDEFSGANAGLLVAELELASIDSSYPKPDWLGQEVTDDPRYLNSNLVAYPFSKWH